VTSIESSGQSARAWVQSRRAERYNSNSFAKSWQTGVETATFIGFLGGQNVTRAIIPAVSETLWAWTTRTRGQGRFRNNGDPHQFRGSQQTPEPLRPNVNTFGLKGNGTSLVTMEAACDQFISAAATNWATMALLAVVR
jgi:hypothetical protein